MFFSTVSQQLIQSVELRGTPKLFDIGVDIPNKPVFYRFYFVHSYHVVCNNDENILATTNYGKSFTCSIYKDNIYGVQFHPEKSHKFGMQLLKNFGEM